MKTMTCAQMGGMCEEAISATTPDEMISNGMEHVKAAHPEMAESIKNMAADDPVMLEWKQKFDQSWEATPEE